MRRLLALTLFLFSDFFSPTFSQDCASIKLASTDVLETVEVFSNEFAIDDGRISYEIAPSAPSNSFDQVSDPIRILTATNSTCPASCTLTLNRYTDNFQGNQSTILFFDTDHSFYLPSHYVKDNTTSFVCTTGNGYCGASIPIYRYYKISNGGVYHAYSFEQDITYDGYNQEWMPICYAWPVATGTVAARPTCGTLNFDTPLSALTDLKIYDNFIDGIERDHYYTTLPSTDPSLAGYNQTGVLGKVLTSSKSTACSCLVKLQQQFDNQTGYFHRLDHKLIVNGQEQNRPYEEYVDTGEAMYCAKRLGDCGATLPLWKHFQFYDVDTVYTTDSSPLPMSYLYPQVPLCYIWPTNYAPNASNIPAAPPTSYPSASTVAGLPATKGTPGVSLSTGSTPILDVGGGTPVLVTITTTASAPTVSGMSGSTMSPIYPASSTPMPGGSMATGGSTMSPLYPASSTPFGGIGMTGSTMSPIYPPSSSPMPAGGVTNPTMSPIYPPSLSPMPGGSMATTAAGNSTMSPLYPPSPTSMGVTGMTGSTMSPIYPPSTSPLPIGMTGSTMSPIYPPSPTPSGATAGTGSTMSPIYPPSTSSIPAGGITNAIISTIHPASTPSTASGGTFGTSMSPLYPASTTMSPLYPPSPTHPGTLGTLGTTPPTTSVWGTASPTTPGTGPTISVWGTTPNLNANPSTVSVWGTASPTTPGTAPTVSVWGTTPNHNANPSIITAWGTVSPTTPGTGPTISVWGTTLNPNANPSTVTVWGTASPTTPGTSPTISVWGTTPNHNANPSTISIWGTASPTTPGTGPTISVWGTTPNPNANPSTVSVWGTTPGTGPTISVWGTASPTTPGHLADPGAPTIGPINPVTATGLPLTITHNPAVSETFTLSDFWYLTTTKPPVLATASPAPAGSSAESSGATAAPSGQQTVPTGGTSGPSASDTPGTPATTAAPIPTMAMITGPLFSNLNQPLVTIVPMAAETTTGAAGSEVTGAPSSTAPAAVAVTTHHPVVTDSSTTPGSAINDSSLPVLTTGSPQHIAQAPTYSIVGGPLNQITNPPIIEALISSFNPSSTAPPPNLTISVFLGSSPISAQPDSSTQSIVKRDVSSTSPSPSADSSTTPAPGILWKAGDWISNTWHSVFGGGGDQKPANTSSSTGTPLDISNLTTTTSWPLGGLVGSVINSTGNFFNDTKTFIGNTIGSNSSSNVVSNFLNSTGNVIGQAMSSNATGGSFINNTKNWIDDKWDSTGEFLSNAWNSLGSSNGTAGGFLNSTKTWVGGAMNSTGNFFSNAWNETKEHSETFMNSTGGAIAGNVTSAIGGLIGGAKDAIGSAGEAINGLIGGSNGTVANGTAIAVGPLSNAVGSVATAIITSANNQTSTVDPSNVKIEWNGGRIDGPLTG